MGAKGNKMTGNSRKRPYGMMLLLAFGAAVLSVVVLHKLRERRVFGLLLQDRDRQLLGLQLLLQKEREHSKEVKRKIEDLKAKTISLKTQKMELANKLMETQVTATYLKKIQREMETALEEKQNKVTELTEKEAESITVNLRVAALVELLKQKEDEVEAMKHRLENLNPPKNITTEDKIYGDKSKEDAIATEDGQLENFPNSRDDKTSKGEREVDNSNKMAGEQPEETPKEGQWVKFETNVDEEGLKEGSGRGGDRNAEVSGDQSEKLEDSQKSENPLEGGEKAQGNALEVKEQTEKSKNEQLVDSTEDDEILKIRDGNSNSMEGKDQEIPRDGEMEKHSLDGNDQQVVPVENISETYKSSENGVDSKMRVNRSHRTKTKRRKHRVVSRERELEKNENSRDRVGLSPKTEQKGKRGSANLKEGSDKIEDSQHNVGLKMQDGNGEQNVAEGKEDEAPFIDGQSKNSQYDENSSIGGENADHSKVEDDKKGTFPTEGLTNMSDKPAVTEGLTIRAEEGDKYVSKSEEHTVVPNDGKSTTNSHADEGSDGMGKRQGRGEKDETEDKEKETVSSNRELEMPEHSEDDEKLGMKDQSNSRSAIEAKEEKAVSTDSESQKTQNPGGGEVLKSHERDSSDEIAQEGKEKEVTSTDGQAEKFENSQHDEGKNESNSDEHSASADLMKNKGSDVEEQDGSVIDVIKEPVPENDITIPKESEARNVIEVPKSRTPEDTTETIDASNNGESKDEEDREHKKDADNSNSDHMA